MGFKSAAEALLDDQVILGEEYGLAFHHACQELWRVSYAWDRYEALFGTETRVELLNQSGSAFWGTLQNLLFDDVLLGLCRLTDPPRNRHQKNLGIRLLLELEPSTHKVRLGQAVNRSLKKTEFARKWRDKRIAHNDFEQMTNPAVKLPFATGNRVVSAIISIHHVLRWIMARHSGSEMFLIELGDNDAVEVMAVLADGLQFRKIRSDELKAGRISEAFHRNVDWMGQSDPRKRYEKPELHMLPKKKR
jgi:AbiU2